MFIDNKLNGLGTKHTEPGIFYRGNFQNWLKDGKGYEEGKDFIYEGDYYKDKKHGKGFIKYTLTGEEYEGDFEDNQITGFGQYRWSNGDSYLGTFLNGKMNGKGEYKWPQGGYYIGEYTNNIKEGEGIFQWPDGKIFEGPFVNGKPHGQGIMTQGGKTVKVIFQNGKIVKNTKSKTSSDNSLVKRVEEKSNNE